GGTPRGSSSKSRAGGASAWPCPGPAPRTNLSPAASGGTAARAPHGAPTPGPASPPFCSRSARSRRRRPLRCVWTSGSASTPLSGLSDPRRGRDPSTRQDGRVLLARDLSVEVGGRLTLEEASFDVRAGDKVALVGRNGAGKTSLSRALAGDAPAAAGSVVRRGRLGYLPQEPRAAGDAATRRALDHVLGGRDLDQAVERLERLRLAV